MKRFKSIVMIALAVMVGVAYALPASLVSAADAGSSASLSIAPKKNYVIEPGKSVKDRLTIRNLDNSSPLELNLRVVDFSFTDDGGTPKLFLAPDAPQTTWSLKPFLKIPESVTIPPRGSKSLDMSVSIPANQGAGSYYSAIVYSSGAPETANNGNVGLNASGVTLAFVSVPGKVNENLKLERLGAYDKTKEGDSGFVSITAAEPLEIAYRLKNSGNVVEAPVGSITLRDLFGQETKIERVNPTASLALIGQTRTFHACIKLKEQNANFQGNEAEAKTCTSAGLWPGFYSISLDLFYGQNGNLTKEITGKSWFVYMPLWFIIVLLIALSIAAWYIRKLVLAIQRKRNGGVKFNRKPARRK